MTTDKPEVVSVYRTDTGGTAEMVCISDYSALQVECEKLRKDAERYRWLRDGCDQKISEATRIATNCYGDEWDSRIDDAMAKEAEKLPRDDAIAAACRKWIETKQQAAAGRTGLDDRPGDEDYSNDGK